MFQKMCAPALQVMKSAPVACVVVIVLIATGAKGAFITIVAFVAVPPFYIATQEALSERPNETEKVLSTLGASKMQVFCCCTLPSMLPFYIAASKTTIALSWRAGITAELLCLPIGSIGAGVYASKITLDSSELLVWTIVVMVLSWVNEKIVVILLSRLGKLYKLTMPKRSNSPNSSKICTGENSLEETPKLKLVNIYKKYGDHSVLEDFSLILRAGSKICLMAPTGKGKSTVIGVLIGCLNPDAGQVISPNCMGVGMQHPTLIPRMSALDNVALVARSGISNDQICSMLGELIGKEAINRPASDLSGGMKRLVEIVRAIASNGEVIVLDEPFAGLDAKSHESACRYIVKNLKNRALMMTTHDPRDAEYLNARVLRL